MKPWERYASQESGTPAVSPKPQGKELKPWEQYGQQNVSDVSGFERLKNVGDGAVFRNNATGKLAYKSSSFSTTDQTEIQAIIDGGKPADIHGQRAAELTIEQNPQIRSGGGAANFLAGLPFVGEFFDESVGIVAGEQAQQKTRDIRNIFSRANPNTATALQVAGGVTGAIPLVMAGAPVVASSPSLAGRIVTGGTAASTAAATEGAVSGFGSGEDLEERVTNSKSRAKTGALVGGVFGVGAPVVSAGLKKGANKVADILARTTGDSPNLSKSARDIITRALDADGSIANGADRIRAAGDDGLLADAGPNARALLDTSIQQSGPAGVAAREAIEQRASNVNARLTQAFDDAFGPRQGTNSIARDISLSSATAREAAYQQAYNTPIDYGTGGAGDNILQVLTRVPNRILKQAINSANEAMQFAGVSNKQILADIADNGDAVFRELPNVQQLDEIKRALGDIASSEVDQFGRKTASGNRASQLARQLRDSISNAVPAYRNAIQLGGDKIAEDNALQLGTNLLKPSTTRESVQDAVEGIGNAERTALLSGVRSQLDESLANVKRTISDGNLDAREAIKATRDLSSRANQEKLEAVLGPNASARLFGDLEKAVNSLDLRASVADNSKTFARQTLKDEIDALIRGGPVQSLKSGEPVNAMKRIIQAITGATPQAAKTAQDKVYSEIVQALTEGKGGEAVKLLEQFKRFNNQSPGRARLAEQIAHQLTAGTLLPAERTLNTQLAR